MSIIIKYISAKKKLVIGLLVLLLSVIGFIGLSGNSTKDFPSINNLNSADSVISILDKMSKDDYSALKTYLIFLNYMPAVVHGIKGQDIISSEIPVDMKIAEVLREIK
jgi:hypothetical protein